MREDIERDLELPQKAKKLPKWVIELIEAHISKYFYGKITFNFEAGKIKLARKEETIIPE